MFEHLLELTARSAALEAKLEARSEHAELVGEMLELATENAKLKAQVELAQARAEVAQQVLAVTLENEQLKSRVAELTGLLTEAEKNVRTAREAASQAPRR
jgi:seryl-tRNA synthetase